jgi:chemotaxis protein MotA
VKVVLVTHVSGKPALLAIDAGRRLVQLNIKPSFAQLEGWIDTLQSGAADAAAANDDDAAVLRRRKGDRVAKQA